MIAERFATGIYAKFWQLFFFCYPFHVSSCSIRSDRRRTIGADLVHSCTVKPKNINMSTICKLEIRGIRSFGVEAEDVQVRFSRYHWRIYSKQFVFSHPENQIPIAPHTDRWPKRVRKNHHYRMFEIRPDRRSASRNGPWQGVRSRSEDFQHHRKYGSSQADGERLHRKSGNGHPIDEGLPQG